MKIRVTIDHVALRGFEADTARGVAEALQAQIAAHLARPGARWTSRSIPLLRLGPMAMGRGRGAGGQLGGALGAEIGGEISHGIVRGARARPAIRGEP